MQTIKLTLALLSLASYTHAMDNKTFSSEPLLMAVKQGNIHTVRVLTKYKIGKPKKIIERKTLIKRSLLTGHRALWELLHKEHYIKKKDFDTEIVTYARERMRLSKSNIPLYYEILASRREMKKQPQECIICLSEMNEKNKTIIDLFCTHAFHAKCIKEWEKTQTKKHLPPTCPICRDPLMYMPSKANAIACKKMK